MLLYVDDRSEVQSKNKTRTDSHCYSTKHTADKHTDILKQTYINAQQHDKICQACTE